MGIIIGAATKVVIEGQDENFHVSQVSWSLDRGVQRMYELGSWDPYLVTTSPTETLNMTVYSPGPIYDCSPTTECANANTLYVKVYPAMCATDESGPLSTKWYVTSYSYSKSDGKTPATESWSMMQYVNPDNSQDVVLPTYNLRGISEGSGTDYSGIVFNGDTTFSTKGDVSAGGIGNVDTIEAGVVIRVGGSSNIAGTKGEASVSMPYTPIWV